MNQEQRNAFLDAFIESLSRRENPAAAGEAGLLSVAKTPAPAPKSAQKQKPPPKRR